MTHAPTFTSFLEVGDVREMSSRELLDKYAVLAMLPPEYARMSAPLLVEIRNELLSRLEQVQS